MQFWMIFLFLGVAMFRLARAFFSLFTQFLRTGRCHLVDDLFSVGGSLILELLGWCWWLLLTLTMVFYQFLHPVFQGIAWWTMFLWLLIRPSWFGSLTKRLPGSPYHHNRRIRRFIQSPGPYEEAYDSRLVLLSAYQVHGW